jgi:uncharacterized protein DUF6655
LTRFALLMISSTLLLGCSGGIRQTTTARAAEEMLLVSTAAERAVDAYPAEHLAKKRVWIDESFFESVDKNFVISCVRERIVTAGAALASTVDEAEVVLELRNATLGVNDPSWAFGIPALPIGTSDFQVVTPELAFGYDPQKGWAKFQFWSYSAQSGETLDLCETWGRSATGWFQSITPSVMGAAQEVAGAE